MVVGGSAEGIIFTRGVWTNMRTTKTSAVKKKKEKKGKEKGPAFVQPCFLMELQKSPKDEEYDAG